MLAIAEEAADDPELVTGAPVHHARAPPGRGRSRAEPEPRVAADRRVSASAGALAAARRRSLPGRDEHGRRSGDPDRARRGASYLRRCGCTAGSAPRSRWAGSRTPRAWIVALCVTLGVDVVRRFTGGRGVLHDDELTYSRRRIGRRRRTAGHSRLIPPDQRCACRDVPPARGRRRHRSSGGRGQGFRRLLPAQHVGGPLADGRKLSGSAQVWLHDTVLQHGSFVITRDVAREAAVFGLDDAAALRCWPRRR